MPFPDSAVKRKIPDDLEALSMVAFLVRYTGMTKDQVVNRAIEIYYNRVNFYSSRKDTIQYLLNMNGHRCHYCKNVITRADATLDHKTPTVRGGDESEENIVLACKVCNGEKDSMTEEEYLEYRKRVYGA